MSDLPDTPRSPALASGREALLRARLRLLDYAVDHSSRDLLQQTLDEVGAFTDSPIGFFHFVSDDQRMLHLQAWSTRTVSEFCRAEGPGRPYDLDLAGVWADCIRLRRPVIHNDCKSLPHRKGVPPGHAGVTRELVVPVFRGSRIVAVVGIGNKPADYTEDDMALVAEFADFAWDIARRKTAGEERILALTEPVAAGDFVRLSDLFDIGRLQRFQEAFARATGVASIITEPDGTPITRPSRFCRLCKDVIRGTEKGLANCLRSDSVIGRQNPDGPTMQPCLSGGLWDAGASITVGGRHLANWLIGQVKDESFDETTTRRYAEEIGADPAEFEKALAEVPVMSSERFAAIADAVFIFAQELSAKAYQNVLQARFIADRKRTDEERARLESQLQQARKLEAVGRLAGGVAHDLNNMLSPVLGYGEMLHDELAADDPRRGMAGEIVAAAERARELVRQLLAFGRKQAIDLRPLDLNEVIAGLEPMLRRTTPVDVAIVLRLDPSIGKVKADSVQVEQVILNLAANAQEAMPSGGTLTLETAAVVLTDEDIRPDCGCAPGPHVLLSIRDSGSGMDRETLERIFDPFFTTKEMGKGTGLGLATVYGIVKQHGASIDVTSEPGRGTLFRIWFPRTLDETASVAPAEGRAQPERGFATVLVVEDQAQVRRMVGEALRRWGYEVLTASSGEEALATAASHPGPIHLLLTDVIMTTINGRELRDRLSRARPGLRVLFMSGYTNDIIGEEAVPAGTADFIQKPFSLVDLITRVRDILERE